MSSKKRRQQAIQEKQTNKGHARLLYTFSTHARQGAAGNTSEENSKSGRARLNNTSLSTESGRLRAEKWSEEEFLVLQDVCSIPHRIAVAIESLGRTPQTVGWQLGIDSR